MTNLSCTNFFESDCHCSLTGINIDYPEFINNFGEGQFSVLTSKLEAVGFHYLGILRNSAIFTFPATIRGDLRDEIDEILEKEVFAD
jgi:hypothetical protein